MTTLKTLAIAGAIAGFATMADAADISAIPSGVYNLDKNHGYVTFTYTHLGFSHPYLRFRNVDAVLDLDSTEPENSSVNVTIDANSIDSGVDVFDGHLRSADWFDVEQFPEITFVSTALESAGEGTGTMTGDLTIKGVTKSVTLDVTLNQAANHPMRNIPAAGFSAQGTLKRSDWGLGKYAPGVSDDVKVIIETEFHSAEPPKGPEGEAE